LEEYTHMTPARGFLLWGGFISAVLGLSFLVHMYYPDRPSAPKEYPEGLEPELGGKGSLRVRQAFPRDVPKLLGSKD
jgi:NADH dehydrogenase (ubiquinone) 1 beta subcomplex subunit 8